MGQHADDALDYALSGQEYGLEHWEDFHNTYITRGAPMPTIRKQTPKRKKKVFRKKSSSVIDRIQGIETDDGLKLCLYGRSGTGKTRIWSTFPKPILAMIVSGGNRPGELRSIDTPENRKVIKKVELAESKEVLDVVDYIESEGTFQTVVLDHVSGLQDLILKEVVGLDEAPAQLSWGLATQQDYGQVALQMKTILRKLLSLSGDVVIVGQERDFDSDGDSDLVMPYVAAAVMPSVVGWLNPAVDYIGHTFIRRQVIHKELKVAGKKTIKEIATGKMEYCLRTGPDPVYTTKFRVPPGRELPDVIVNSDYKKILEMIQGVPDASS